ncbi:MAG TPA: exosortase A [Burkholderiaceae bacterium]|nr:exosortase A [Burkholderiaceae bacterium]
MRKSADVSSDSTLTFGATPALGSHRAAVVAAGLVIVAILVAFADTAGSMARIWLSSDTFSHGVIVVPISLWLISRKHAELRALPARPCLRALPLAAIAGLLWLVGRVANANVIEHFALVLMIQSAVLVVLGWAIARAIAFPLLFLFFAVPFGEAFVPTMIDWTADFTVLALKATGIPVYREGNSFAVPTGHWAVAEACSGIRYLIASMMAGTLFAYLVYSNYGRRAAFIALSIVVPIAANWLRAYLIVLLGHLSSNKLATGVDHVIYGWIFFGVVLLTMFALGMKLRPPDSGQHPDGALERALQADATDASSKTLAVAAIAALSIALPWSAVGAALMDEHDERPRLLDSIADAKGWVTVADPGDGWRPAFRGERVARRQVFERDGQRITLYVLYYWGQSPERKLVSASNTLLASTAEVAHEVSAGFADVTWSDTRLQARRSTISAPSGRFDVVWCYWVDGRVTGSEATAKSWIAQSRLRLRGDDSAAVFVSTQPADQSDGGAAAARFAGDMSESISRALVAARDGGPGPTAKGSSR